jgi:hypothetical protein
MRLQYRVLGLFLALASNVWAQADSKSVSIALPNQSQSVKKPAQDLLLDGRVLDVGQAAQMAEKGFDLADLNPQDNKFWQNKTYSASDAQTRNYPAAAKGVKFVSSEAAIKLTSLHLVQSAENPNLYFRLSVSFYTQPMLMRAALLRKLGYFVPSPKYYKDLRVQFKSQEEKDQFLKTLSLDMGGVDLSAREWILSDNKIDHSLVLSSSMLEVVSNDNFDLYLGTAPDPAVREQLPAVQRYSRNRAFRSLIIPYALVDVPESVNRFSVRFGTVSAGFVSISHPSATSFQACTYEDARWLLKKLQNLKISDYQEIVREGNYPPEIEPLVLAKLINRSRDALSLFQLSSQVPEQSLEISSASGLVQDGKVMKDQIPGYPQRFSHLDRKSPFEQGDFMRYLNIEGKSSVLSSLALRLNERLELVNTMPESRARAYRDFGQKMFDQIRRNPNQPVFREVISYPWITSGLNLNASRHISTGTFTGSTAPLQLVDNISVGAGLGVFNTLETIKGRVFENLTNIGANVFVVRDFTHVRPVLSMKDVTQVPWKEIYIPSEMNQFAELLASHEKVGEDGVKRKAVDVFLTSLKDGEVFTVSDSVVTVAALRSSSTLDVLFGLGPFSFMNSVTGGADMSRIMIRQLSIHRVINANFNGLHVYVRELKNQGRGLELNGNFFINLLKIRAEAREADIKSDGFVLRYKDAFADEASADSDSGKKFLQTQEDFRQVLIPLLKNNNPELLSSKFENKKFKIRHNLKADEFKLKFLAWRFSKLREEHKVELTYPKSEKNPELDPNSEKITLFSSKRGELKGRDLLGFSLDLVEGLLQYKGQDSHIKLSRGNFGDNPANAPFGKAYWRLINTESDLTDNGASKYPTVATIQHVWGGWSLSKDKFFQVISEMKNHFKNTEVATYQIINPQEFVNVRKVDFYRITANLSVLGEGLDKVRDLILQPQITIAPQAKHPFAKLVQALKCPDRNFECLQKLRRANDQELFSQLLLIFGDGDMNQGREKYLGLCREEKSQPQFEAGPATFTLEYYKGTPFECLSGWTRKLMKLAAEYPADKVGQTRWLSKALDILDENIPLPQLLKFLGTENYLFLVRINGFRAGDEDGDLEYFSNTVGDPKKDYSHAAGLVNIYVKKTGLMPTELDRNLGGFQ